MATFNKNEVVLEKIKQASLYDLENGALLNRLTSIEEPVLNTTAEKEEVLDAQGNTITDIYRAKKATFGGTNSLFSFDLAASQFGAKKEVASAENKIRNYVAETKEISGDAHTAQLSNKPVLTTEDAPDKDGIRWVYIIESGEIGEAYLVGAATKVATDTEPGQVTISDTGLITFPDGVTGKVYVEYVYESEEAIRIVNKTNEYPTAGKLVILALFRDRCTDKTILGSIICPKAKLDPESVELSLTPTGKHPFQYTMMKDFCSDDEELFEIVLSK